MKRVVVVSVLAFLLFVAMRSNDATPLGVRVTIAPSQRDPYQLLRRATPETYRCSAVVYDATFTVAMSRGNDRAATEVVGKRGEKIVLRQKSDVALRAPKQAIVPLW